MEVEVKDWGLRCGIKARVPDSVGLRVDGRAVSQGDEDEGGKNEEWWNVDGVGDEYGRNEGGLE